MAIIDFFDRGWRINPQGAAYIQDRPDILTDPSDTGMEYHHHLWIRFFEGLGQVSNTLKAADK